MFPLISRRRQRGRCWPSAYSAREFANYAPTEAQERPPQIRNRRGFHTPALPIFLVIFEAVVSILQMVTI